MKPSIRLLTKLYSKMIKVYNIPVEENKVNCFVCSFCDDVMKTIDVDFGITPEKCICSMCREFTNSTNYVDVAPDQEPTVEWYRPTLKEITKLRGSKHHWRIKEALNGGLFMRAIKKVKHGRD